MEKKYKICPKCYCGKMIIVHIPNVQAYIKTKSNLDRKFIFLPKFKINHIFWNGRVIQRGFSPKKEFNYASNLLHSVGVLNTIYYMCDYCNNSYMKMHVVN
jgi:hypothetical protein